MLLNDVWSQLAQKRGRESERKRERERERERTKHRSAGLKEDIMISIVCLQNKSRLSAGAHH